jgi:hypothetical protein
MGRRDAYAKDSGNTHLSAEEYLTVFVLLSFN